MPRHDTRFAGGFLAALVLAFAAVGAMATTVTPRSSSDAAADTTFVAETARAATTLRMMGQLAMQEGDDEAIRAWGRDLADEHDAFLAQLAAAARPGAPELPTTVSARQQDTLVDLSQWRSHWFDRRVVAAAIEEQLALLSTLQERVSHRGDRTGDAFDGLAEAYVDRLHTHVVAAVALRAAAGEDPPEVVASGTPTFEAVAYPVAPR